MRPLAFFTLQQTIYFFSLSSNRGREPCVSVYGAGAEVDMRIQIMSQDLIRQPTGILSKPAVSKCAYSEMISPQRWRSQMTGRLVCHHNSQSAKWHISNWRPIFEADLTEAFCWGLFFFCFLKACVTHRRRADLMCIDMCAHHCCFISQQLQVPSLAAVWRVS